MNLRRSLADALLINISKLIKIPDTKNDCFKAVTSKGDPVFIKVFEDAAAAQNEFGILRFLSNRYFRSLSFRVPAIRDFLNVEGFYVIVSDYIVGNTARGILLNSRGDAYATCGRMVLATAEIHSHLLRNLDIVFNQPYDYFLQSTHNIQARLESLIHQEGGKILTTNDTKNIVQLQTRFFYILSREGNKFPCDYYKDANPANSIFAKNTNQLIAVDFEGNRLLPFFVDLINIMEYAKNYLSAIEKQGLIDYYISTREKLSPDWRMSIANYNIQTLYCLFSIFRHHEQMLHRIRDIEKSDLSQNRKFHFNGYFYHFGRFKENLGLINSLLTLSEVEKCNLFKEMSEIFMIYLKAIKPILYKVP